MILHAIEVRNAGRFRAPVRVGAFCPGLNVIAAPNEQGKSTLVTAAARCLFDRHTTRGEKLIELQPAGTTLAPEVAVEFETAEGRFRIEKRFLVRPESRLSRWTGQSWASIAESEGADDKVREMLRGSKPGAGASRPEHWGLLQYLWARQGDPAAWPEWGSGGGEKIRQSLVQLELDPVVGGLQRLLTAAFDAELVNRGRTKANSTLAGLEDRVLRLEGECQAARVRREEVDRNQARCQALGDDVARLASMKVEARRQADALSERVRGLAGLRQAIDTAQDAYDQANAVLQAVSRDGEALAGAEERQAQAQRRIAEVNAQLEVSGTQEEKTREEIRRADADVAESAQRLELERQAVARLEHLLRRCDLIERLSAARKQLDQAMELQARITEKTTARGQLPRLTLVQVRQFQELEQEIRELEVHLEAAGLSVELRPGRPATVRIESERGVDQVPAAPDQPGVVRGLRRLLLDLEGWGRIVVTSGARELEELNAALQEKRGELDRLRERTGVADAARARVAFEAGREIDVELRTFQRELDGALGEQKTEAQLRAHAAQFETLLMAAESDLGELRPGESGRSRPELEAQATEGKTRARHLETEHSRLVTVRNDLQRKLNELLVQRGGLQNSLREAQLAAQTAATEARTLGARYPEGIAAAKDCAQTAFVQAEARRTVARRALPADAEELPGRLERAVKAAVDLEGDHDRKNRELLQLEAVTDAGAGEGLASKEARLAEQLAVAQAVRDAVRGRAQAAGLLAALIERRRGEAIRTVLSPLEEQLSAAFAQLTGVHDRRVSLDENLAVTGVGPAGEQIPFGCLSQGAREQLLLALRAAAARVLSAGERQVLILDDVLVNADPVRQQRVLDYLVQLGQSVQVLILTCHADRYAGLPAVAWAPQG